MNRFCYDCGKIILNDDLDKEHIPAKCFFVGYGDKYKTNRITVDAHKACNHKYSKIDQELRDAVGILTNNQTDKSELTEKAIRSIMRKKTGIERVSFEDNSGFVDFNYEELRTLHIKNFKGIFFHEYGKPIPQKFTIEIGDQECFSMRDELQQVYNIIDNGIPQWNISGHSSIFKYKIVVIDIQGSITKFDENSDEQLIVGLLVYHEEMISICIASPFVWS